MYGFTQKNKVDTCSVSLIHENSNWYEVYDTVGDDCLFLREMALNFKVISTNSIYFQILYFRLSLPRQKIGKCRDKSHHWNPFATVFHDQKPLWGVNMPLSKVEWIREIVR